MALYLLIIAGALFLAYANGANDNFKGVATLYGSATASYRSALVLAASRLGVPVSTTHVSCGALFGIGLVTGEGRWRTILSILTAWVITLPLAAGITALCYTLSQ